MCLFLPEFACENVLDIFVVLFLLLDFTCNAVYITILYCNCRVNMLSVIDIIYITLYITMSHMPF